MTDPLFDWALQAAKLRFGPHVVLQKDGNECLILLERPPSGPTRQLARAATWPDAMIEAVKVNTDIPQAPMEVVEEKAPEGDEHIEEFVGAMRRRDLLTEFLL